jgi:hypothetical protein
LHLAWKERDRFYKWQHGRRLQHCHGTIITSVGTERQFNSATASSWWRTRLETISTYVNWYGLVLVGRSKHGSVCCKTLLTHTL